MLHKHSNGSWTNEDEVLVVSEDENQHNDHLKTLFERFSTYGVHINVDKCRFGQDNVDFLEYHVTADGVEPPVDRVEALREMKQPQTVRELRRFLGMINFYRRFIPKVADVLEPITSMLQGTTTLKQSLQWNAATSTAFNKVKDNKAIPAQRRGTEFHLIYGP